MRTSSGFLGFAALCLSAIACRPEGGALAMRIYYPAQAGALRGQPSTPGEAPTDITHYRLTVLDPSRTPIKQVSFDRADHPKGGRVDGLDAGQNFGLVFQGFDKDKNFEVRWCGQIGGIEVREGEVTQVSMFISICSGLTTTREALTTQRAFHTATLLEDGRMLIAGGFSTLGLPEPCDTMTCLPMTATDSIEIYDPRKGTFESRSDLKLRVPRALHTATALPGNRVLLAGGVGKGLLRVSFAAPRPILLANPADTHKAAGSAELLDLETMALTEIALNPPRALHAALSLTSGDVVLLGGFAPLSSEPQAINSVVRFEAQSGRFTDDGVLMQTERQAMAAAPFGEYGFLWGGNRGTSSDRPGSFAEVLTTKSQKPFFLVPAFVQNQNATQGFPSLHSSAAACGENRVLITGGILADDSYSPGLSGRVELLSTFRVVDLTVNAEAFVSTPSMSMFEQRALHTASALPKSRVLVAGGFSFFDPSGNTYQPSQGIEVFSGADLRFERRSIDGQEVRFAEPRAAHAAAALQDGSILMSGGLSQDRQGKLTLTPTAELYNPASRSLRAD